MDTLTHTLTTGNFLLESAVITRGSRESTSNMTDQKGNIPATESPAPPEGGGRRYQADGQAVGT